MTAPFQTTGKGDIPDDVDDELLDRIWDRIGREEAERRRGRTFFDLAIKALRGDDILPLPILDGHDGDPYLTAKDYADLLAFVAHYAPDLASQWQSGSQEERRALLEIALCNRDELQKIVPLVAEPIAAGTKLKEADVPAAFRESEKKDGHILSGPFLNDSDYWRIRPSTLSKHYGPGKMLTTHIQVGHAKVYLQSEIANLHRELSKRADARDARQG